MCVKSKLECALCTNHNKKEKNQKKKKLFNIDTLYKPINWFLIERENETGNIVKFCDPSENSNLHIDINTYFFMKIAKLVLPIFHYLASNHRTISTFLLQCFN